MRGECDGLTTEDEVVCTPCRQCRAGQYLAGVCNGDATDDVAVCMVGA